MECVKIPIPIYDGSLILYKVKKWKKINKKYFEPGACNNRTAAVTTTNYTKAGQSEYIVAFKGEPLPLVIAHESLHVVNLVFRDRGVKVKNYNDEHQAYFLDWVYLQIENFLKNESV